MKKKTFLFTGGTGFIGSNMTSLLLSKNYNVKIFDNNSRGSIKKIKTLQSDEYYEDKKNVDKNVLIKKSDIIIIATPHKAYKNIKINKNKVLVDVWGLTQKY